MGKITIEVKINTFGTMKHPSTPPTPYGPKVALPEFQPMDTYDLNLCDSDRLLHVSMTFQRYLK